MDAGALRSPKSPDRHTTATPTCRRSATEPLLFTTVDSPIGGLLLLGDGRALCGLHIQQGCKAVAVEPGWQRAEEPFGEVRSQLAQYFAGRRMRFDLPLAMRGTSFQNRVWDELQKIPYGRTATYGELGCRIGQPSAARAVGLANGSNPISVIVPCHRLVGANGALTGYGGGLERKQMLLSLEADSLAVSHDVPARWGSTWAF